MLVFLSLVQMDDAFRRQPAGTVRKLDQLFEPLRMVSGYGLFAVMTTERNEIIIEGSDDGVEWREYAFRYKPGNYRAARPGTSRTSQDWTGKCGSLRSTIRGA